MNAKDRACDNCGRNILFGDEEYCVAGPDSTGLPMYDDTTPEELDELRKMYPEEEFTDGEYVLCEKWVARNNIKAKEEREAWYRGKGRKKALDRFYLDTVGPLDQL